MSKFENKEELVIKKEERKMKLLRILSDIPAFVWKDSKNYGPFAKEDVVNIPEEVGEILIKQGKACEIIEDKGESKQ